ncbi:MAG TPA: helix-turn-helix transcriptional regulator [Desulfuromonadales bacterium]|nr:helix-turn-helix transcriptional regulator [Desulfuromonadales bacterium]
MNVTYEHLSKGIAARLSAARKNAGLSQTVVAKRLAIPRPSLSEVESGRRRLTANEFILLANLYNVSLDWLAGNDDATISTPETV